MVLAGELPKLILIFMCSVGLISRFMTVAGVNGLMISQILFSMVAGKCIYRCKHAIYSCRNSNYYDNHIISLLPSDEELFFQLWRITYCWEFLSSQKRLLIFIKGCSVVWVVFNFFGSVFYSGNIY